MDDDHNNTTRSTIEPLCIVRYLLHTKIHLEIVYQEFTSKNNNGELLLRIKYKGVVEYKGGWIFLGPLNFFAFYVNKTLR